MDKKKYITEVPMRTFCFLLYLVLSFHAIGSDALGQNGREKFSIMTTLIEEMSIELTNIHAEVEGLINNPGADSLKESVDEIINTHTSFYRNKIANINNLDEQNNEYILTRQLSEILFNLENIKSLNISCVMLISRSATMSIFRYGANQQGRYFQPNKIKWTFDDESLNNFNEALSEYNETARKFVKTYLDIYPTTCSHAICR